MPVNLERGVVEADLTRIVQDIFLTMLAMEVAPAPAEPQESPGPVVTASMHLAGPWNGAVVWQCPLAAACEFTAVFLGIEAPSGASDDVKDVMGELINMVAGNFKALLGGGVHLSMPTVVEGADYHFQIQRGAQTARVGFHTPAGPLWVSLVELREGPGAG